MEQTKYLSLTQDAVFKKFFTSNKQVLISLFECFLPITDKISDVFILRPRELDKIFSHRQKTIKQNQPGDKLRWEDDFIMSVAPNNRHIILDFKVTLSSGKNVNVEMPAVIEDHFLDRVPPHYVLAKRGIFYRGRPAYVLMFEDLVLFEDSPDYIHQPIWYSKGQPHDELNQRSRLVMVELSKLKESCFELVDMKERWCYIMKKASELTDEEVAHLSQDKETKMILEHLEKVSKDGRLDLVSMVRKIQKLDDRLEERGFYEKGLREGHADGMGKGKTARNHEIALNMLQKGYQISEISEVIGISTTEIEQLKDTTAD